jgi:hypothetical protein
VEDRLRQSIVALMLLGTMTAAAAAQDQSAWMPPPMEEFVVKQLVERLREINLDWSVERMTNAARVTVATIRARLEKWTEPELLKRAPALAHLQLPASGDPRLDAMLRYHMCTAVSMIRHERRAKEPREEGRIAAVAGMTTGSLAVLFLRDGYIKAGGSEERVEKLLTDPKLQSAIDRMQTNPDDISAAQSECVPVLGAITG